MATNNSVNTTLSGQSGTGAFAGTVSPVFTTPNVGIATGTSFNTLTGPATQADQEAATSIVTAVTPGRQQYHPSAAKAWGSMDTSGGGALNASYNCTATTKNGVGDWTMTLTVPCSSGAFCIVTSATTNNTNAMGVPLSASTFQLLRQIGTTAAFVDGVINFVIYGDQ